MKKEISLLNSFTGVHIKLSQEMVKKPP